MPPKTQKNKTAIIIIAILGIIGFYVGYKNSTSSYVSPTETNITQTSTPPTKSTPSVPKTTTSKPTPAPIKETAPSTPVTQKKNYDVIVTYTSQGFSPLVVDIKAGQTIRFINGSSLALWVASNPYPTNDFYPEFNQGKAVGRGGTFDFQFIRVGSWSYHNDTNPSKGGTVIVHVQ